MSIDLRGVDDERKDFQNKITSRQDALENKHDGLVKTVEDCDKNLTGKIVSVDHKLRKDLEQQEISINKNKKDISEINSKIRRMEQHVNDLDDKVLTQKSENMGSPNRTTSMHNVHVTGEPSREPGVYAPGEIPKMRSDRRMTDNSDDLPLLRKSSPQTTFVKQTMSSSDGLNQTGHSVNTGLGYSNPNPQSFGYGNQPSRKMPKYDGKSDLQVFFYQFEGIAASCNWTQADKISRFGDCLQDAAAVYYSSLSPEQYSDFSYIKNKFQLYFGHVKDRQAYEMELNQIRQGPHQNIQEFGQIVSILASKAYSSPRQREERGAWAVLRGCHSAVAKQACVALNNMPKTIDEAIQRIISMDDKMEMLGITPKEKSVRRIENSEFGSRDFYKSPPKPTRQNYYDRDYSDYDRNLAYDDRRYPRNYRSMS